VHGAGASIRSSANYAHVKLQGRYPFALRQMVDRLLAHEDTKDLAEDLAKALPRWVSWIPVVGKASYRRWVRFRTKKQPENRLQVELLAARIDLHARDEAFIQLDFQAMNFGPRALEIDRVEVVSLQVGSRRLRRRGEMFAMSYSIPPMSSRRTTLHVDLLGGDLRHVVQGISKAVNGWTSPDARVSVYGSLHCLDRGRRFRKALQHDSTSAVFCNMSDTVVEALLNADGLHD